MAFSLEHDKFLLEAYFRSGQTNDNGWKYSMNSCHLQFQEQFPNDEIDDYEIFSRHVKRLVERFHNTGSICRGKSPGRKSILTEEVLEDVENRLRASPTKSLRRLSAQTGISYGSCHKAVKKLHFHPYKVSVVQELLPLDFGKRVQYCNWFNENLNDDDILDLTFFSDEAWFHLSGYVNSQNYRSWNTENPNILRETTLHPIKLGVWVAMSRRRIIGPYFFHENVTGQVYRQQILLPFFEELHDDEIHHGYFQQDGATAHTSNETLELIREYYDDRIISRDRWPPRSPDLTPLDYYLFGFLKNSVFAQRLHTIEELQEAITNEIRSITQNVLHNVFNNMKRRINTCLNNNGRHIEHLL